MCVCVCDVVNVIAHSQNDSLQLIEIYFVRRNVKHTLRPAVCKRRNPWLLAMPPSDVYDKFGGIWSSQRNSQLSTFYSMVTPPIRFDCTNATHTHVTYSRRETLVCLITVSAYFITRFGNFRRTTNAHAWANVNQPNQPTDRRRRLNEKNLYLIVEMNQQFVAFALMQ